MARNSVILTIVLVSLLCAGWYIDAVLHDELVTVLRVLLYGAAAIITASLGVFGLYFVLATRERVLMKRAERKQAQQQAEVYSIVSDHGIFVRDLNAKAIWRPLHLNPGTYQNGLQTEPSAVEVHNWQLWVESRGKRPNLLKSTPPLLFAQGSGAVDLLTALDRVQRCLIVGASDSGKTTLLQHIIARRASQSEVVVIDPHASPSKWPVGTVVGIGRDYAKIGQVLSVLVRLMTKRYDEIGKGLVLEGQHQPLTIIIDEWRAIFTNLGKPAGEAIKALLTESRKAAFSVFVASHTERVRPLGLENEGDLKDGFTVVRLASVNGQRQATFDAGSGEVPAQLPGPYGVSVGPAVQGSATVLAAQNLPPRPDRLEQQILELAGEGLSVSAIAEAVFGSKGGNQNQAVKAVLTRFGALEAD